MDIVEHIEKRFPEVGIQAACFEKTYFAKDNVTMQRFRCDTGLPNLVCRYRDVREPIAKIVFGTDTEGEIAGIGKAFYEHPLAGAFQFVSSEQTLCEILPLGMHKGVALQKLVEYLGADLKKTVAVGDYDNDVGMLRAAGLGIAVANSSPAALAAADTVTVSNEEHAIARVITDLENGVYRL
jgi:hydroxymethylpyrimidine pyrophosphatase-like HAD family hydrolase